MNTIKFVAQNQNQTDFANALSKSVRNYFKANGISSSGDYRIILKAVLMLGLYLSALILVFTVHMPAWMALILMIIMGIGEAGIGMSVMHDAAHGSFSKHSWLNVLMSNSLLLLGSNVINWKIQHNLLHHTYPNVHEWDGDIGTKSLRLSSHSHEGPKIFRYQHLFGPFLYGFMTIMRFFSDLKDLKQYGKMGALDLYNVKYKTALRSLVVTKLIYLIVFLVLPFLFTDFIWWQILLGFIVFHATASVIMGTVFQMAHIVEDMEEPLPNEDGVIQNQHFVHQLVTTSNFGKRNGLFSWYIGGLNYQVEHHLFPHICHIHYPKLAPIVAQTAADFNQPYHCQKNAYTALRSHLRTLKRLGRIGEAR